MAKKPLIVTAIWNKTWWSLVGAGYLQIKFQFWYFLQLCEVWASITTKKTCISQL